MGNIKERTIRTFMKTQKITAVSSLSGRNVWKRSAFFLSQYSFKSLWFIADLEMCYCKIFITWWCIAFCMYFKCIHLEVLKRHFFEKCNAYRIRLSFWNWNGHDILHNLLQKYMYPQSNKIVFLDFLSNFSLSQKKR